MFNLLSTAPISSEINSNFSNQEIFTLLFHSVILGSILTIICFWGYYKFEPKNNKAKKETAELLISSSNVLFISIAMCSLIILVNNNLARAFVLGAAIALVRFKMKLDGKTLASAMLFGILVGMACGVHQIGMGWVLTGLYSLIQTLMIVILKYLPHNENDKKIDTMLNLKNKEEEKEINLN